MVRNIRYVLRGLRNSPVFTSVAVLSLALGIGGNTAVFSVLDAVLLKPLPIYEPEKVVTLATRSTDSTVQSEFGYPSYVAFRDETDAWIDIAAYSQVPVDLASSTDSVRTLGSVVSSNYFKVLGVVPLLGSDFRLQEEGAAPSSDATAIISNRCWKRYFQSDVGVIGKSVSLNGRKFTVIGVLPPNFAGTVIGSTPDVWVPTAMWAGIKALPAPLRKQNFDPLRSGGYNWLQLFGRMKSGVGIEAVQRSLKEIHTRFQTSVAPDFRTTIEVAPIEKTRLPRQYQGSMQLMLIVIFAVVAGLLLIACANVASLLVCRAAARQKDISIRLALGAQNRRIVFEILTESVVLSMFGGGAGILVAVWLLSILESWRPLLTAPIPVDLTLDLRVLGFTIAVSIVSGVVIGLAAAMRATSADPGANLKNMHSVAKADRRPFSAGNLLVIGQVAVSLVLLVGAGLLLRTFLNVHSIDVGFDPRNLILLNPDFLRHGYSETSAIASYQRLLERIGNIPGVESASLAQYVPLSSSGSVWRYDSQKSRSTQINTNSVTPGYFKTMGIPILRGRDFNAQDWKGAQKVAIINEAYAQLRFKGREPIGSFMMDRDHTLIIAVAKNNKNESLRSGVEPWSFVPFAQVPDPQVSIVIRTVSDPTTMVEPIRRAALAEAPTIPASSIRLMTDHLSGVLWQPRIAALLVGGFALLAALLAAVGVYGVVSFDMSRRTHEIGVRMALGATRGSVLRMMLARGVLLGSTGAGFGIWIAVGLSQMIAGMLYGVSAADPGVFAAATALLILVVVIATLIPVRRATGLAPIDVLRQQ